MRRCAKAFLQYGTLLKKQNPSEVEKFCLVLAAEALLLFHLAELEELFVCLLLGELLEASHAVYVAALDATVVAAPADFLDDTRALDALLKTSNDVRAALVVVFFNLDVYCHMWAREYHAEQSRASAQGGFMFCSVRREPERLGA